MVCHILIQIYIFVILDTYMYRIMWDLRMYKMFPLKVDQCLGVDNISVYWHAQGRTF